MQAPIIPPLRCSANDGHLDLFKAVYNHVVREYNEGKPLSLRMSTRVDVPAGSGLGSSSTLTVAMLAAYAEWLNLPLGDYELAHTAFVIERVEAGLQGGKQDQYAAAFGGFNFMEFGRDGRVLVNPLRIKDWVVSELEASLLLYFTENRAPRRDIIEEQSRNVRDHNELALDAMHSIKEEAFRMKECLLRGDFHPLARGVARQLGIQEENGQPDYQRTHRAPVRLRSQGRRALRQDLRRRRRRVHDVPHRPHPQR